MDMIRTKNENKHGFDLAHAMHSHSTSLCEECLDLQQVARYSSRWIMVNWENWVETAGQAGLPAMAFQALKKSKHEQLLQVDAWTVSTVALLWLCCRFHHTWKSAEAKERASCLLESLCSVALGGDFIWLVKAAVVVPGDALPINIEDGDTAIAISDGMVNLSQLAAAFPEIRRDVMGRAMGVKGNPFPLIRVFAC